MDFTRVAPEPAHSNDCGPLPENFITPRHNSTTHDRLHVSENRYSCEIFKYYKSNDVQCRLWVSLLLKLILLQDHR